MCFGGGGREREGERKRETFPYEMVLEEVSLCIQASVLESHCGKVWQKGKKEKKNHFTLVSGQWQFVDLGHFYILPLIS